jgi:hypothetical protein
MTSMHGTLSKWHHHWPTHRINSFVMERLFLGQLLRANTSSGSGWITPFKSTGGSLGMAKLAVPKLGLI